MPEGQARQRPDLQRGEPEGPFLAPPEVPTKETPRAISAVRGHRTYGLRMYVLTRTLAGVALLVVVASGLASCGGGSRSSAVPAFCARLPAADVARVGHLSGQVSISARGPQECDYGTASENKALIGEEPTDRTAFDKGQDPTCTPEAGLGEAAYACMVKPDFLVVHFYSHGHSINVQVNSEIGRAHV